MNVITKFSALGLAAVLFAACSDSSSDGQENLKPEVTGIGVVANSNGSTVTNYKVGNVAKALRRADAVTMPEYNRPADAVDITSVTSLSGLSGNYYVPAKKEFTLPAANYNLNACNIYVENGATLNVGDTTFGALYVNTTGTVNFSGTQVGGKVVNYGTFNVKNDTQSTKRIFILRDFYSNTNLSLQKSNAELYVSDKILYVNGSLRAMKFEAQSGANVTITGDAHVEDGAFISKNSDVTINGYLAAQSIDLGGENVNTVKVDKYIEVKKEFGLGGKTSLYANSIDASRLKDSEGNVIDPVTAYISGDAMIYVNNAGYLTFDNLSITNARHIQIAENSGVACFKARTFNCARTTSTKEPIQVFSTPSTGATFLLELSEIKLNNTVVDYDDAIIDASYYDYADAQSKDGVKEVFDKDLGYRLNTTDFGNLPKLDLISTVENNANDYMSATCIAPVDGKLYVSYHTRGSQHGASIEVFNMNHANGNVTRLQTLSDTNNSLDFNHCTVANNRLYLSGSQTAAGAGFAYIDIKDDGTLNTTATTINNETVEPLQFVALDKSVATSKVDANWATMFNGNLIVASTAGYYSYTLGADGPTQAGYFATDGKAKSLTISNNQIYGLSFTSRPTDDETEVNAVLNHTGNAALSDLANANTKQNIGIKVGPTNGKNSIIADNNSNSIFVCCGKNGLYRTSTSGWSTWAVPTNTAGNAKGYANGVAVDNDYVYVACGGYGLVVLDKATGKELCHRTVGGSANYVAVDGDGYIYVANGQSRVQVFKLNYTRK